VGVQFYFFVSGIHFTQKVLYTASNSNPLIFSFRF